jgi:anti-sigma B factor antagonist
MGSVDPLRIIVDEERQAVARAQELIAYGIRSEWAGEDIFVVSLAGEHDLYTAPKVQEELRRVIAAGARITVVDLTKTSFLDSTILQVLLSARNELRDGGRLVLVTNDGPIKRVFEIAGVDRFFDFYPSRRAAEEEVRSA